MSNSSPDNKTLLSISQAAETLGVSKETIRNWDRAGVLRSIRQNGDTRYFQAEDIRRLKNVRPLSIFEASKELNISPTTLRRLESKGILVPERNNSGERVYSKQLLNSFKKSTYFQKKTSPVFYPESITENSTKIPQELILDKNKLEKVLSFRRHLLRSSAVFITSVILIILTFVAMFITDPSQAGKYLGYQKTKARTPLWQKATQPFAAVALEIVKLIDPNSYDQIIAAAPVEDVSDIFTIDDRGNITPVYTVRFPSSLYLEMGDKGLIKNLNADYIRGKVPGSGFGNLVVFGEDNTVFALRITAENIIDGAVIGGFGGAILDSSITDSDISPDTFDFTELEDTLDLDAETRIALGTNNFTFNLNETGDFIIEDGGTTFATFTDAGVFLLDSLRLDGNTLDTTSGNLNLDSAGGTTRISDNAVITGTLDQQGAIFNSTGNVTFDDSVDIFGNTTITGDLAVNGDDITSDGNLTINATGYTRIGDTATPGLATGDDDLYVEGDLEVDGTIYGFRTLDCTDCIDFDDISDNPTLDATTTIGFGANNFVFNLDSTGDFLIQDAGTPFVTFSDDGSTTFTNSLTFTGAGNHDITASSGTLRLGAYTTTGEITLGSGLDILATATAGTDIGTSSTRLDTIYAVTVDATNIAGTLTGGNTTAAIFTLNSDNATADTEDSSVGFERGTIAPNAFLTWDSTNDEFDLNAGLHISDSISPVSSVLLALDATGAGTTADGLLISQISSGTITDAIDVSDETITNAINVGGNNIVTSGATISSAELDVLDAGITLGTETDGDYVASITAGNGLTGSVTGEGSTPTLHVVSANGGIVTNADNIALTLVGSADGLSATTSSGSGLEVLSTGLSLLQGCATDEVLKWNETTDVWACGNSSLQSAYNSGNTITTTTARDIEITLADVATDTTFEITQAGSADILRINDDGTFTDTTPFVIDASGNVGIGTTAPATTLQVAGTITVNEDILPSATPTFSEPSITSPDTNNVSQANTSIVLDSSGFPVVAYKSSTSLKIMHCNDVNCAGGDESITTPNSGSGSTGQGVSLVLDASGFPVVSFGEDQASGAVRLLHCNDVNCAGSNENVNDVIVTGSSASPDTSLVLDASGFPVISYYDGINGDLELAHCNDVNCAGGNENITVVDGTDSVGRYSSLRLDSSGFPVISYYDGSNTALKIMHCNDVNCVGQNESITTPDNSASVGEYTSLRLDASGFPVVSYYDNTNQSLKIMHCNDANCAGGNENINTADSDVNVGLYTSLALDSSGFPVVSYSDQGNTALKLLHCNDANCAGGNENESTPDNTADVGKVTSLALDSSGFPVVSYHDSTNGDLKILHCVDANCSPPTYSGSDLGSTSNYFANLYVGKLFAKDTVVTAFDLAESYRTIDGTVEAGDLVSVVEGTNIEKAKIDNEDNLLGVVSTKPGITLSEWENDPSSRPVALAGRVPTKVSGAQGKIKPGDRIAVSNIPGVGVKATKDGNTIGVALEGFDGNTDEVGKILVFVENSWFTEPVYLTEDGELAGDEEQEGEEAGEVPPRTRLSLKDLLTRVLTLEKKHASMEAKLQKEEETATDEAVLSAQVNLASAEALLDEKEATLSALTVTGKTNLYDLGVVGNLNVGTIFIDGLTASLDSLGTPLQIQATKTADISFLSDLIVFDKEGNVKIKEGRIIVGGSVAGTVEIKDEETKATVTFPKARSQSKYAVTITPSWLTEVAVTDKKDEGFVVEFSKSAPSNGHFDWVVIDLH